jgi:7-carboxy-7-deazaguanine synthase
MSEVAEFEADASTEASGVTPAGENSATPAGENSATPAAENSATPAEERAVASRLKITEIFYSLQGEADTVGFPTVFVRLTGCPLRCQFCDTAYAFHGGEWFTLDAVLGKVRDLGGSDATAPRYVCVTGGEPLAQKNCLPLLSSLCDAGYRVSIETSGAMPIEDVDPRVVRVVDVKTPGSGEERRNRYGDLELLRADEQIKFVICDRADYEWSRAKLTELALPAICTVLFSPSAGQLEPRLLADWILADRLPVRFQMQLHKVLWGNVPGK